MVLFLISPIIATPGIHSLSKQPIKKDIKVKSNTSKKDEKPKSEDIKDSKKAKNSKSDN